MAASVLCLYGTTVVSVRIPRSTFKYCSDPSALFVALCCVAVGCSNDRPESGAVLVLIHPDVIYHIVPLMKPVFVSGKPYYAEYILMEYIMFQ